MSWWKRVCAVGVGVFVLSGAAAGCASSEFDEREPFDEEPGTGSSSSSGGSSSGDPLDMPGDGIPDAGGSDTGATDAGADAPSTPTGNPVGFPCLEADDCASGECKKVLAGSSSSICVSPCTTQADCADNFFCDPATPGDTAGFCVPRSPAHCMTCTEDADCGSLSERCGVAEGDSVKACHVDCSIAGDAACPADYACVDTKLGTVDAKVCRPKGGLGCLDALGGFCDRVSTPQSCARTNSAGTCVGQRACLTASNRLDTCGAQAPACKTTCSSTEPAGCTTTYCLEATSGPANCGACGKVCPGHGKANTVVGCNQPECTFACSGESYDVDDNVANGCEVTDPTKGNHTVDNAINVGNWSCKDNADNAPITGHIPSDSQIHLPPIEGFDGNTGSAPDWFKIFGVGSLACTNQVYLRLTMQGSTRPTCYNLWVETSRGTWQCNTDATGTCLIDTGGSSRWDDDTFIYVRVSKRNVAGCTATSRDKPSYSIKGHF